MLLVSTLLNINESMIEDDFIKLVLEWNNSSKYSNNIVAGIDWHGEHSAKYGTHKLWMEFVEHPESGIIAVRHEKVASDGMYRQMGICLFCVHPFV